MSENDEFEPEVINPNLTQDDVLSLSAVYGLTLNKRQKETAMKNDKLNLWLYPSDEDSKGELKICLPKRF